MSLDVSLKAFRPTVVFENNITHNLGAMAKAAGIYSYIWRPIESGILNAYELIAPLEDGLDRLEKNPDYYKTFNPQNGWGIYEDLVGFVKLYINSCKMNPDAQITACR